MEIKALDEKHFCSPLYLPTNFLLLWYMVIVLYGFGSFGRRCETVDVHLVGQVDEYILIFYLRTKFCAFLYTCNIIGPVFLWREIENHFIRKLDAIVCGILFSKKDENLYIVETR